MFDRVHRHRICTRHKNYGKHKCLVQSPRHPHQLHLQIQDDESEHQYQWTLDDQQRIVALDRENCVTINTMTGAVGLNRCAQHHPHPARQGHELASHRFHAGQSWHYNERNGHLELHPTREMCLTAVEDAITFTSGVHVCRMIERQGEIPGGWSIEALGD